MVGFQKFIFPNATNKKHQSQKHQKQRQKANIIASNFGVLKKAINERKTEGRECSIAFLFCPQNRKAIEHSKHQERQTKHQERQKRKRVKDLSRKSDEGGFEPPIPAGGCRFSRPGL